MDWNVAQSLIVPLLYVAFEALKRVTAIGEENQYIPLCAIVLGVVATVLWALAQGSGTYAVLFEAVVRGAVMGAASVGLYELIKGPE